jgi:hypothetical protein
MLLVSILIKSNERPNLLSHKEQSGGHRNQEMKTH